MTTEPLLGLADPVSSVTHMAGAIVALLAAGPLIARGRGRIEDVIALAVFAGSAVLLLAVSGVYHTLADGTHARDVLQRLDHAAIFVLIAGTFTPVHTIVFRGLARWGVLAAIWTIAIAAIALKTAFFTVIPEAVGLSFYLGLGWLGAGTGYALWRRFGTAFVRPALFGAFAYTIGALVGFSDWPNPVPGLIGSHELFHFASLAGVYWHWRFIHALADGERVHAPGTLVTE